MSWFVMKFNQNYKLQQDFGGIMTMDIVESSVVLMVLDVLLFAT